MRQAVIDHLRRSSDLVEIVGNRIYGRQGLLGGISRDQTPEAFDADGRLQPSLVVVLESRVTREARDSLGVISATQTMQVWCLSAYGYEPIKQALRLVRAELHRTANRSVRLIPVDEEGVAWTDTVWASTSPELHDADLQVPTMFSRFDATITETLP